MADIQFINEPGRLWNPLNEVPVWMQQCAQEVNDKYPNLNLSWIPPEFRGPKDTRPFAIVEIDREGNTLGIVARFTELEFYPANIFNWLYEHDTANTDVWGNLQKMIADYQKQKDEEQKERVYELADQFQHVVKSNLHTYRINGHKVGAENNAPTLGLYDASGEDQQDGE